ncbi:putative enoyl-CoA hydratase [Nocardia nova SH22a]|uniref:Putative enoyl-CoA hydratase n=1 Tax=Nocardia nova SH22a TaxID=1415166 RepID=W5TKQ6_9NOCA|nr:enoyl-CoA hydratase [Nocardia nova]AHH19832.1 putative enoyl-CoA hydratase [Nocardia nova SH22a]
MSTTESDVIRYEIVAPRVARITLAKPNTRNAQDTTFLYDLNAAFDRGAQDDDVSVIVLNAEGPHFSAGHDLREQDYPAAMAKHDTVGTWCGFGCEGAEGHMAREKEIYLGFSERWRNIPKPTIAAVHGKVIAGGLMLAWPCDLIVAADDAEFIDNTLAMGVNGVEFFHHPWEMGVRQAKEMLFTSEVITADNAYRLGMVNHVVPRAELEAATLELAERIARMPLFALKLTKESINAAQDAQGRPQAMQTSFALHQLAHTHNRVRFGDLIDPNFTRP